MRTALVGAGTDSVSVERSDLVGSLASVAAWDKFILDSLAFPKSGQAGSFHGRNMNKRILRATTIWLNESESLGRIEPFNCTGWHSYSSVTTVVRRLRTQCSPSVARRISEYRKVRLGS